MAGHSKWKQIKHKKAITDSKRGKKFTKLLKEITMAAKVGGGDPAGNARLRHLMEKGKEINMPLENTIRAIKKGTGELPGQSYERYVYEGYGPGNIAVIVEVLTDNKNKAIAEMRTTFSRNGGTVGETGTVGWMFDRVGALYVNADAKAEDALIETLLAYDIKDITHEDGVFTISCDVKSLDEVRNALNKAGYSIESAEIEWFPKDTMALTGETEEKAHNFLEALEDLDDVQNVYTNLD